MRPSGRINLIGLVMIAAVVGGIYAVILLAPAYADNMDVQSVVSDVFGQMGKLNDHEVRNLVRSKLGYVGTHQEYDRWGILREVQGLGLKDEQIVIDRNDVAHTGSLRVDYERMVQLKPLQKLTTLQFHPSREGTLGR